MEVLRVSAESMQRDRQKLQGISQNIANSLTPGYKRQLMAPAGFSAQVSDQLAAQPVAGTPLIDPSAGTMRFTGIATDVAIEGDAFFEVMTADGLRYTRQGSLRSDTNGRLLGPHNHPIQGVGGDIVLSPGAFSIAPNGQVSQDGRVVGQLKLVQLSNAGMLQPAGNGLYALGGAALDASPATATIRSGYLENSNIDSAREMVSLTDTVRHFEALTRIAQGYDDALGTAIRKLGEF